MINKSIFRAYDIRGIYGTELNAETARLIGKAFATLLQRKYGIQNPKIAVGRDNRTHGQELREALIKGLRYHGAMVLEIPDCTSPMLYFAVASRGLDAGINVTASHNPAQYNGFKLVGRKAYSMCGDEIQEISRITVEKDFSPRAKSSHEVLEIFPPYRDFFKERCAFRKPWKIVIDAGNGICGKYLPELFRSFGAEVIELYCDQDGRFPNHEPDPIVEENTSELSKKVLSSGADLGLSFDGDGDRFTVVDQLGKFHDANQTFALLISDLLSRHASARVVYTVSCSLIIPEIIKARHGVGVMTLVGHSFVEQAMRKHKAMLGGEQSGHYFMTEDFFGYDDAAFAAAVLLKFFEDSGSSVSSHYESLPKVFAIPELRIPCPDDKKFELVDMMTGILRKKFRVTTLDGVRVDFPEGGFLGIRASNTSPCISIIMEAKTKNLLTEIRELSDMLCKKCRI